MRQPLPPYQPNWQWDSNPQIKIAITLTELSYIPPKEIEGLEPSTHSVMVKFFGKLLNLQIKLNRKDSCFSTNRSAMAIYRNAQRDLSDILTEIHR